MIKNNGRIHHMHLEENMKKKILIFTDNLLGQVNGVVTTYNSIKRYTENFTNGEYQITFVSPSNFERHFAAPGYSEVRLTPVPPWRIGFFMDLYDPDYIHIATEGPIGLAAKLWMDHKRMNYTTAYHTRFPEFLKSIYGFPQFISKSYLRWFHSKSSCVFTTTSNMVNELRDSLKFKNDKIIPWSRGIDESFISYFEEQKQKEIFHVDRNKKKPIALYVGRVSKEKNLDVLCSLQYIYQVRIVGDGPYRRELEDAFSHVDFYGYLRGDELAQQYLDADVFVFPSRSDTFGIVMIEAMAMGTPVAAYEDIATNHVVTNGINGYIAPLDFDRSQQKQNLITAIEKSLQLNRNMVRTTAITRWTWKNSWEIFRDNLFPLVD